MSGYIIDHWSASSLGMFLRNRLAWKKEYVHKIYDKMSSPSAVVGKAAHIALETYLDKSTTPEEAIQAGMLEIINMPDTFIDFGKTGSREQMMKDYTQVINFYLTEFKKPHKVLGVERKATHFVDFEGKKMALPAKAVIDLISENEKGEIELVDHKMVASFSDANIMSAKHWLQAMFNYFVARQELGRSPARMFFNECKTSKNRDGSAQLQPYIIDFETLPGAYWTAFFNLYAACTNEIARGDLLCLPNFFDMFDGDQSFEDYVQNLTGVEAPILTQHKTEDVRVRKVNYIESAATKKENEYLPAEQKIKLKLEEFGIPVDPAETYAGASVMLYTFKPHRGVKMRTIEGHAKDLALAIKAKSIRVEAPMMGTNLVAVQIPREDRQTILLTPEDALATGIIEPGRLLLPIGQDVFGKTIVKDLSDMPHLLVAGTTGAGKSVAINGFIKYLAAANTPEQMQLVLVDPKRVEFSQFRGLPHLLADIIYEHEDAKKALDWLVEEMEVRYRQLEASGHRNITEYNAANFSAMPRLVTIVDEYADLMLQRTERPKRLDKGFIRSLERMRKIVKGKGATKKIDLAIKQAQEEYDAESMIKEYRDPESSIIRLAQKARAVGIHLIIATQRPSVDVITGIIKANLPTRIAFMTDSGIDSRIILDEMGAEELVGRGDMLFKDPGQKGLVRLQGFLH